MCKASTCDEPVEGEDAEWHRPCFLAVLVAALVKSTGGIAP